MLVTSLLAINFTLGGVLEPSPSVLVSCREGTDVVFRLVQGDSSRVVAREANPDDRGIRFIAAVSSDGRQFLRVRPSGKDGELTVVITADVSGKQIGEYPFSADDPAAWWYGWDGAKVFAAQSLPTGKWKLWVQGSDVRSVDEDHLPTKFRKAIARSPNKAFHTNYPESTEWTIGYLTDAPDSVIPESPYAVIGRNGIGTYDSSSVTFVADGELMAFRRPSTLVTWWNVRYLAGRSFLAIGLEGGELDRYDPQARPFLKTFTWLIESSSGHATRLCPAVYAVPLPPTSDGTRHD